MTPGRRARSPFQNPVRRRYKRTRAALSAGRRVFIPALLDRGLPDVPALPRIVTSRERGVTAITPGVSYTGRFGGQVYYQQ